MSSKNSLPDLHRVRPSLTAKKNRHNSWQLFSTQCARHNYSMGKVLSLLPFCGWGNWGAQRMKPFAQGHRAGTLSPHVKSDTAVPGQAPVTLSACGITCTLPPRTWESPRWQEDITGWGCNVDVPSSFQEAEWGLTSEHEGEASFLSSMNYFWGVYCIISD